MHLLTIQMVRSSELFNVSSKLVSSIKQLKDDTLGCFSHGEWPFFLIQRSSFKDLEKYNKQKPPSKAVIIPVSSHRITSRKVYYPKTFKQSKYSQKILPPIYSSLVKVTRNTQDHYYVIILMYNHTLKNAVKSVFYKVSQQMTPYSL